MNVRELEELLLLRFPASRAEAWDRTGLLVGDPDAPVGKVAVALDPSLRAIRHARRVGATVLVTHHPVFLDPPTAIRPPSGGGDAVAGRIWEAVSNGISILSFHTALDASPLAAQVLAAPLGLTAREDEVLEPAGGCASAGYGRICPAGGMPFGELAARCRSAFGRSLRAWGDDGAELGTVCLWTGAAGSAARRCVDRGIDALVCGEIKYHEALDASEMGLCIIELGHDVSEQVHCPVLVESLRGAGVPEDDIYLFDLPFNWR